MKNEEIYNKIMNFKIKNDDGKKVDYLSQDERNIITEERKKVKTSKILSKLLLIVTIAILIMMFILAGTSRDLLKIPTVLKFTFFISLILIICFYCMFAAFNYDYKKLLKSYYTKYTNETYAYYASYAKYDIYLAQSLYEFTVYVSGNDKKIMANLYNCINDPKTYYIVHKEEINKHSINIIDDNVYLVGGIMSLLENHHYVSILDNTCTKDEFLKEIRELNEKIDVNEIEWNDDNSNDIKNKVKIWIHDVNKVLKEKDKTMILFKLDQIYKDKVIICITDINNGAKIWEYIDEIDNGLNKTLNGKSDENGKK